MPRTAFYMVPLLVMMEVPVKKKVNAVDHNEKQYESACDETTQNESIGKLRQRRHWRRISGPDPRKSNPTAIRAEYWFDEKNRVLKCRFFIGRKEIII